MASPKEESSSSSSDTRRKRKRRRSCHSSFKVGISTVLVFRISKWSSSERVRKVTVTQNPEQSPTNRATGGAARAEEFSFQGDRGSEEKRDCHRKISFPVTQICKECTKADYKSPEPSVGGEAVPHHFCCRRHSGGRASPRAREVLLRKFRVAGPVRL